MARVREQRALWAHELHSRVLNSIGAVIIQSQVCERAVKSGLANSGDEVARLREMLLELEISARALLSDPTSALSPRLADSLEVRLNPFRQLFPDVSIVCHVHGAETPVPSRIAKVVVAVVSESVANALKHGVPSRVEVNVASHQGMLLLRIRDNGQGFDVRQLDISPGRVRPDHFGVASMRQLAESVDGNLAISSAPGRGTQVTLHVAWAS